MRESANSLVAPGAGRTVDIVWPSAVSMVAATAGIYSRVQYRQPGGVATFGINATGVGSSLGQSLYKGVPVFSLNAAVATVPGTGFNVCTQQTSWTPTPALAARTAFLGTSAITRQVTRLWANMAFVGTPVSDQDFGLEMLCAATVAQPQSIIHGATPGIGWIHRASGALSVVVLGPNGLIFNDVVTPADYDPTLINSYEFQIIGPTAQADAQLVCLLNGIQMHLETWAAGTNLPSYNAALAQPTIQLINYGGNNLALNVQTLRFVVAPTLLDTL